MDANTLANAIYALEMRRSAMRDDLLTTHLPRESAWYQARVKAIHDLTAQIRAYEDRLYRSQNA